MLTDSLFVRETVTKTLSGVKLYRKKNNFRDGRTLVGGGKSRMLHVWSLESRKLMKILQLPAKVTVVKQLEFLSESFDGGSNQVGKALRFCILTRPQQLLSGTCDAEPDARKQKIGLCVIAIAFIISKPHFTPNTKDSSNTVDEQH